MTIDAKIALLDHHKGLCCMWAKVDTFVCFEFRAGCEIDFLGHEYLESV